MTPGLVIGGAIALFGLLLAIEAWHSKEKESTYVALVFVVIGILIMAYLAIFESGDSSLP